VPSLAVLAALSSLSLAGCGTASTTGAATSGTTPVTFAFSGQVHGGQNPVNGSTISLYAAGKTGLASAPRSMLTSSVTTNSGGYFNITGKYACNSGDQVYIVATGGNAGSGSNSSIAMMTALGPCATLLANASTTYIAINEVTTVASVYSLAAFMTGVQALGSDATNTPSTNALAAAFANTSTLVNTATGIAPLISSGNGIVPQSTIYSLANALAACINSTASNSTACTKLFTAATVSASTPTDTLQAALNVALNPAANPTGVFNVTPTSGPFQPTLTSAPASWTITVAHPSDVLTYHYNAARTGVQPYETQLTTANVTSAQFGKKFTLTVDGYLYAQLLYVGGYGMPDGLVHNVLYAATAHGSVYAFDADGNNPSQGYLWKQSLMASGETQVLQADYGGCGDTVPESSLLGTPVIDRSTGTLYVVSTEKITANGTFTQKIHALSLLDGTEKFNGPTVISATYTGTGAGAVSNVMTFSAIKQNQRPALLESGGTIWITWASHCDYAPYHGYIIGYSAADVSKQTVVFNNTPNGSDGGIWMSGGGPAADAQGYVYVVSGNGTFDANTGGLDYGDTGMKLSLPTGSSTKPTVVDYFTPSNQATLSSQDQDVGVTNALIFTDSASTYAPTLMLESDKTGRIYLLNAGKMGTYNTGPGGNTNGDIQDWATGGDIFNNFAYFNGVLYAGSDGKPIEAYEFNHGSSTAAGYFTTNASSQSMSVTAGGYGAGGSSPVVSANGTLNAIIWTQDHSGTTPLLHAYEASNLNTELYNSGQAASSRDAMPTPVKFTSPVVVNGSVYVGGVNTIAVYGLLP
jgi:hypothetical protein